MVTQIHYSIDKEPEICAQLIAQRIKAEGIVINEEKTFDELLKRIGDTFEEMAYEMLMKAIKL